MKLFYNAKFYSMEMENKIFRAILVQDGKIIETYHELPQLKNVEKIDLDNAFVYPGFIDTHTHSFEGGLYSLGADLKNVSNLEEVFTILSQIEKLDNKIFAYQFDENLIAEKRFPTKDELDKIFPETPVLLRRIDGHSCVINSAAAKEINWKEKLPTNFNGYLRKKQNGEASNWFHHNLDDEAILRSYHAAAEIGIKTGHTAIHTMIGNAYAQDLHFQLIKNNIAQFPIEFILYPQITNISRALELGSPRIGGCILADGSFGSYTAALKKPYSDNPQEKGILYKTDEFWENFILEAHEKGLQIAIHCIGDAAISQILKFYEKAQMQTQKDIRHIIVHNELTSDKMLDRIAAAGISATMQPMFDRLWAGKNGLYEKRLGKERTLRTNRLRSIIDRKILVAGGSDWYITELNALAGIDAAIRLHNPEERISRFEAVELYTKNAARLSFNEKRLGTISKDKQADLVILEKDIFSSENIKDIQIKRVIKKGEFLIQTK